MKVETGCVFDASVLMAYFDGEEGSDKVEELLEGAVMSSVNWCEVFGKLRARGSQAVAVASSMAQTGIAVLPFGPRDAEAAGELFALTRAQGLSLADRACLALAARVDLPAVTAERAWTTLDVDVEVVCIR